MFYYIFEQKIIVNQSCFFFKRCHKNKQIIEKYSNFPLKLADKKLHYGSFHGLYWKCKYTRTNGFTFPNIGPLNHIRCWAFTNVLCIKQCSGNVCNLRRSMIFIAWFNFRYFLLTYQYLKLLLQYKVPEMRFSHANKLTKVVRTPKPLWIIARANIFNYMNCWISTSYS